jgi:hypothetical protein
VTDAPLPELGSAERAEDFFEALGVPYDRAVVAVHRTRILRLLGVAVARLEGPGPVLEEPVRRAALRDTLREVHEQAARGPSPAPHLRVPALVQLRRPRAPR